MYCKMDNIQHVKYRKPGQVVLTKPRKERERSDRMKTKIKNNSITITKIKDKYIIYVGA